MCNIGISAINAALLFEWHTRTAKQTVKYEHHKLCKNRKSPEHLQEVSFSTAADLKKRSKKMKKPFVDEESLNGFKENRRNKSCLCVIFVSADKSQSGYSYTK